MATTVLLARHGETDWNRDKRWQGHADQPLNDAGWAQAAALRAALADEPLDAVYSSDLRRAYDTAAIVAAPRGLDVVSLPELREIDVGEWSGLSTSELEAQFPAGWERHIAGGDGWEHGETHDAMSRRIVAAVGRIAEAHPGERVLCVLHGGVIRALLAHADGIELGEYRRTFRGPANGAMSQLEIDNGRFARVD